MHAAVRIPLAVIAGVVVAFAVIAGIEAIGHQVYPVPAGLDLSKPKLIQEHVQNLPLGALLFVLVAWLAGAFIGGVVAAFVARARAVLVSATVGTLVLAATIANLIMIPHPLWMAVAGIAGVVLAAWFAGRIMSDNQVREGLPRK